nr:DNA-directed RNA polymerase subunit omega [uncultured Anaeromusa sp.]
MIKPSLDVLMTKVDSKYTLVVLAAKRARTLLDEEPGNLEGRSKKQVTVAMEEIASGRITYERTKHGIK